MLVNGLAIAASVSAVAVSSVAFSEMSQGVSGPTGPPGVPVTGPTGPRGPMGFSEAGPTGMAGQTGPTGTLSFPVSDSVFEIIGEGNSNTVSMTVTGTSGGLANVNFNHVPAEFSGGTGSPNIYVFPTPTTVDRTDNVVYNNAAIPLFNKSLLNSVLSEHCSFTGTQPSLGSASNISVMSLGTGSSDNAGYVYGTITGTVGQTWSIGILYGSPTSRVKYGSISFFNTGNFIMGPHWISNLSVNGFQINQRIDDLTEGNDVSFSYLLI